MDLSAEGVPPDPSVSDPSALARPDLFDPVRQALRGLSRRRGRARAGSAGASGAGPSARAAVLVPLFPGAEGLEVLLIRRPDTLRAHAGQVACPGGKLDPGETEEQAALRETQEELGIDPARVELLGALHDIDTSTGFLISPWVGRLDPSALQGLVPDPAEVARVFTAPLAALADPQRGRLEIRPWEVAGRTYDVPYFHWEGELIWGATGRLLLDLLDLLWPEKRLRERRVPT